MPAVKSASSAPKTELRPRWSLALGDYVRCLAVTPDGTRAIAGLGEGSLVVVDVRQGTELARWSAHAGSVHGLSLSPSGDRLISCGEATEAKLWSLGGALERVLPGGSKAWVDHVAWAPGGERIATAAGRKLRIWTGAGEPLVETEQLESSVTAMAWRADGTGLATACYGGVHLLPFVAGAKARHLRWKGSLISLAWSPDAKVVACGSQDCSVHFWRLASGKDSEMSGFPFKPKALAWSHDSELLATSGADTVAVWAFRGRGPEGSAPILLEGHKGVCTQLAFSPVDGRLASGSQDTSVLLWSPARSDKPQRFAFLEDEVTQLAWTQDGALLLGGDASGTLCGWETQVP